MPPRFQFPRSIRPFRSPIFTSRTFTTTSLPTSKSLRIPIITGTVVLGVGIGLFSLSRVSHAEHQSLKNVFSNEDRESTLQASRKLVETSGNAEKEASPSRGPNSDNKAGLSVESKKPDRSAEKGSNTAKVKDGHDDKSEQSKDNRLKKSDLSGKADDSVAKETSENKSGKIEDADNEKAEGQEGEDEEGRGPIDPDTGEINWDCPCLGDMPHGVCGEQFRKAFSCFVHSKEEPKGQDCIDAFAEMQDSHPDVYKPLDDLDDDELDDQSADDLDTATKKGDEKLNNGTDHTSISTENGKAKEGDGRKNGNQVARSG